MRDELPRLVLWILERRVPAHEREYVVGDLVESWRASDGGWRARWRMGREVIGLVVRNDPDPQATSFDRNPLRDLTMDLVLAGRRLRRSPGFALAAALTIALGAGASGAIGSVAWPVLWGRLPFREADRIVTLREVFGDGSRGNIGFTTLQDVGRRSRSFQAVSAAAHWSPTLSEPGRAVRLIGTSVTASWFEVMGVRPLVGRGFREDEDRPGGARVVVLSHAFWQRNFGADTALLGRRIALDGESHEVIGVMPPGYESVLTPDAELLRPLQYVESLSQACRDCRHLQGVARLRDGVTLDEARRDIATVFQQLLADFPRVYGPHGFAVTTLRAQVGEPVRAPLFALLGSAGVLLLIALANTTNLFVARALQRRAEGIVRTALGARRWRIQRAFLVEAVLLSLTGAILGAALAHWSLGLLLTLAPPSLPRLDQVAFGGASLLVVVALSLGTGLIAGLLSMGIATGRRDAVPAIVTSRTIIRGGHDRTRRALVAGEVALALVLLAGTGTLVQSVRRLLRVDPGFAVGGRISMMVGLSGPGYNEASTVHQVWRDARDAVEAIPGVSAAALSSQLPLSSDFDAYGIRWDDQGPRPGESGDAFRYAVTASYATVMGLRLVEGRFIEATDRRESEPVVVLSRSVARRQLGGASALGARVRMGGDGTPLRTVVGVVEDVRHPALDAEPSPAIYLPLEQNHFADVTMRLIVRSSVEAHSVAGAVRRALTAIDPTITVDEVTPLTALLESAAAPRRFAERLLQVFALVAVVLSGVGLFGVVAAMVGERVREIGVRAALGASRGAILRHFLEHGGRLAVVGIVVGVGLSLALGQALQPFVFGISPRDPLTLVGASLLLATIALGATLIPAWRASRIDAATALRAE